MKYEIQVSDYTLDENGVIVDNDGGRVYFRNANDFLTVWGLLKNDAGNEVIDFGDSMKICPREDRIPKKYGTYITVYYIPEKEYKLLKKWEAKREKREKRKWERAKKKMSYDNGDLPF